MGPEVRKRTSGPDTDWNGRWWRLKFAAFVDDGETATVGWWLKVAGAWKAWQRKELSDDSQSQSPGHSGPQSWKQLELYWHEGYTAFTLSPDDAGRGVARRVLLMKRDNHRKATMKRKAKEFEYRFVHLLA